MYEVTIFGKLAFDGCTNSQAKLQKFLSFDTNFRKSAMTG